jgi:hypothetical protein
MPPQGRFQGDAPLFYLRGHMVGISRLLRNANTYVSEQCPAEKGSDSREVELAKFNKANSNENEDRYARER